MAFLNQNKAKLYLKYSIITLVFKKNAIFCRKLSKIAENCYHNIDPLSQCPNSSVFCLPVQRGNLVRVPAAAHALRPDAAAREEAPELVRLARDLHVLRGRLQRQPGVYPTKKLQILVYKCL
jgi:hypothetical protein